MASVRPLLVATALVVGLARLRPKRAGSRRRAPHGGQSRRPRLPCPPPQRMALQRTPPARQARSASSPSSTATSSPPATSTNRGRLFALSTGLPVTPEVLERLRPQVARQLVDERLRLQEVQRRKISVSDREIAEAIERDRARATACPRAP